MRLRLGHGLDVRLQVRRARPRSDVMRARPTPCTSTRMRPSGSFSMRMMSGDGADRVDVVGARVLLVLLLLRGEQDHAVLGERLVDRLIERSRLT